MSSTSASGDNTTAMIYTRGGDGGTSTMGCGSGGLSVKSANVGQPATGYGGGGGGASVNQSTGSASGGAGAGGLAVITEYCSQ
jgi:hypothetical protein